MVQYNKLRPTVTRWPAVQRNFKSLIALITLIVIASICVFRISRTNIYRISKIYDVQRNLVDLVDVEIAQLSEQSHPEKDRWLPLVDLDGHIFSAFLDPRPEVIVGYGHDKDEIVWSLLRIIAILPTETDGKGIECVYKYRDKRNGQFAYRTRPVGSVNPMKDNWSLKYSAFFVICELSVAHDFDKNKNHETLLPEWVSITSPTSMFDKLRFINVSYPKMGIKQYNIEAYDFMGVCVPVLHHSFNRPLDLVEFVEYYRQLGATHFTFYNSSITKTVSSVLEYYKINNIATVLNWELPSNYLFEKTLRHEGLFAGLNDCLYRNAFYENYEYIANFGIDEFLVPRIHDNFIGLSNYLDPYDANQLDHRYASFIIKNVFFYTMYEDDTENGYNTGPYLYTRVKTVRLKTPHPPGFRSRYIVVGRNAVELGNYQAVELRGGSMTYPYPFEETEVDEQVALSHQYAPCEAEETGCYLKPVIVDKTARKFAKELGVRVGKVCYQVFGSNGCPFVKKETMA